MGAPPNVRIIDEDGNRTSGATLPFVGQADPAYALPVVLARGVTPVQQDIDITTLNTFSSDSFNDTVKQILPANPNRRYLRITNNGEYDVELWTGDRPAPAKVGQSPLRGEVLFKDGGSIAETDTCRTSAIYASCALGTTVLVVLEG